MQSKPACSSLGFSIGFHVHLAHYYSYRTVYLLDRTCSPYWARAMWVVVLGSVSDRPYITLINCVFSCAFLTLFTSNLLWTLSVLKVHPVVLLFPHFCAYCMPD